jgi:hypothetical protein
MLAFQPSVMFICNDRVTESGSLLHIPMWKDASDSPRMPHCRPVPFPKVGGSVIDQTNALRVI